MDTCAQPFMNENGPINRMSTGNKSSKVTFSALIDGHLTGLAHVPEKGQDSINGGTCRSHGFMNKNKRANEGLQLVFCNSFWLIYF
jgi:hypothetical protein